MGATEALVALILATPFALAAAITDLRSMIVPNRLTGAAAFVFLGFVFATLPLDQALWRLAGGALVFGIGFLLFIARMVGGGDAKTAAAFAPMIAPRDAGVVLVLLAFSALIGLVVIAALRRTRLGEGPWEVWSARGRFPYAVALATTLIAYLALVAYHEI
ncbi:MAG: prepilin peptidase [Pikeienuella sp.]